MEVTDDYLFTVIGRLYIANQRQAVLLQQEATEIRRLQQRNAELEAAFSDDSPQEGALA